MFIKKMSSTVNNLRITDCRKFAPNIFNKSKCTNCFRQKEEHSAEALESNRASRKVTKCGYLFVAPGWDFSDPLNRTKRWQRRWFVLYDDGELNYSVDEHPDTVPQAVIDMNQVLEVTSAEDVTGHTYSLAITAPDRVHFVKASCREEARWWTDVLTVFTRSKGRHKRNATFPGGQSTTILQGPTATIRSGTPNPIRPRYNSCHTESSTTPGPNCGNNNNSNGTTNWNNNPNNTTNQQDTIPTRDSDSQNLSSQPPTKDVQTSSPTLIETRTVYKDQPPSSASPPTRDKINTAEKARCRQRNTQQRLASSGRNNNMTTTNDATTPISHHHQITPISPPSSFNNNNNNNNNLSMVQNSDSNSNTTTVTSTPKLSSRTNNNQIAVDDYTTSWRKIIPDPLQKDDLSHRILLDEYEQQTKRDEKLKDIAAILTRPRVRRPTPSPVPPNGSTNSAQRPTRDGDVILAERDTKCKSFSGEDSQHSTDVVDSVTDKLYRNDSDVYGGFVDLTSHHRYSPNTELRVDLPAEDLLHMKKGWLSKQSHDQQWNRHWFVLKGAALTYYRDPHAEDRGIMDGVIDLNGVTSIVELTVARNFGFQLTLWDESRILLSAVTSGIRNNWIAVLRRAAGIPVTTSSDNSSDLSPTQTIEKEPIVPATPMTPRSMLFSSDEEYRTASEGGGRRESGEWCEPLPPSPPLNRTPISRVKERARSRSSSGSRICKRSRSSPPSSRRSTIDSVRTDDLMLPCCGEDPAEGDQTLVEMLETEVRVLRDRLESSNIDTNENNLINKVQQQAVEIEELKSKLSSALDEINNTENEVCRLRKIKQEAVLREKRMEELLSTLENTEKQLTERAEDMEMLKQMYGQDKDLWEKKIADNEFLLRDAAERCELLSAEVNAGRQTIEQLQIELNKLSDRLTRGIDENDSLYKRIRELESRNTNLRSSRDKGRSMDSLSDLTSIDLDLNLQKFDKDRIIEEYEDMRSRFEKAIQEIRAMKRELRESYILYDELELTNIKLKQDMKLKEENDRAQLGLMAERIQDLTVKLTASDKQVRSLKQKLQDSREKRRSLSLKGRESFAIGKEVEEKLTELETKINALESGKLLKPHTRALSTNKRSSSKREGSVDRQSPTEERKLRRMQARLRRKSLDSATSSEPMKVLIRLSSLETKVTNIVDDNQIPTVATSTESISVSDNELPVSPSCNNDRLQTLESVVTSAREKVNECLCQVSLLKSSSKSKRSSSPLSSIDRRSTESYRSIEKCLTELGQLLKENSILINDNSPSSSLSISCGMSTTEINNISDSVRNVVKSLETALRTKLSDIALRRMELRRNEQFTDKMNLQLLAEKLAYESVIIERIHDALCVNNTNNNNNNENKTLCSRLMKTELLETSHLIANLKRKINGKCLKRAYSSKISLDYLTKVLASKLLKSGHIISAQQQTQQSSSTPSTPVSSSSDVTDKMLEFLISKRDEINVSLSKYRNTKMEQLANALAAETLSYVAENNINTPPSRDNNNAFDERRIREAWQLAQETVNNELIQSEISHVMMRCAQMYENTTQYENNIFFSFYASERANLELWIQEVENRLRNEMDENIKELTKLYDQCLLKLKRQNNGQQLWRHHVEQERTMHESRKLLAEFADITAHKALVDARISVLSKDYKPDLIKSATSQTDNVIESLMDDENFISKLSDSDLHIKSNTVLDAEFQFLFQHYSRECNTILDSKDIGRLSPKERIYMHDVIENLDLIEVEIIKLENNINEKSSKSKDGNIEINDWAGVCEKCSNLQHRLVDLTARFLQKQHCQKCEDLQNTVHRLSSEHEEKIRTLQRHQEESLVELRGALENERASQAQLRERARKLERRLGTLDSEYSQQVESLRAAYNKTLSTAGFDRGLQGEENIRQRYQAEIEQLRALCEKGLVAMENSHRRVISELEDKHRREREQLRLEKESALAEETQATLAALDAMRKAHEAEVQREVAKFKSEFVKKMQANPSGHDFGSAFHKENEEEMEEIKQEILSLSEKYSVKCVESAALEEELARVTSQLAQAQQHIMQLDSRNKQLRAHLMSEVAELDTNSLLRNRERSDVNRQPPQKNSIRSDVTVGVAVNAQADSANARGGPRIPWKSISPGTGVTYVKNVSTTGRGCGLQEQRGSPCRNTLLAEPPALSIAELIRSPTKKSCPIVTTCRQPISPCPLAGMVAERKKRFELH